jgi:MFS transporter, ACS family, glucarate transporter
MAAASAGYVCRVAITVVAPGVMHDFALTQAQMGSVFSAFLVGYTVFQIPSGWLADRKSARHIYPVLCAGFTLLTVLTAMVTCHGFAVAMVIPQLWLIRVALGVSAAPTYPTPAEPSRSQFHLSLQAREPTAWCWPA